MKIKRTYRISKGIHTIGHCVGRDELLMCAQALRIARGQEPVPDNSIIACIIQDIEAMGFTVVKYERSCRE